MGAGRSTPGSRCHWRSEGELQALRGRLRGRTVREGFGISPALPPDGSSARGGKDTTPGDAAVGTPCSDPEHGRELAPGLETILQELRDLRLPSEPGLIDGADTDTGGILLLPEVAGAGLGLG